MTKEHVLKAALKHQQWEVTQIGREETALNKLKHKYGTERSDRFDTLSDPVQNCITRLEIEETVKESMAEIDADADADATEQS